MDGQASYIALYIFLLQLIHAKHSNPYYRSPLPRGFPRRKLFFAGITLRHIYAPICTKRREDCPVPPPPEKLIAAILVRVLSML
jgi:hypothetical protein